MSLAMTDGDVVGAARPARRESRLAPGAWELIVKLGVAAGLLCALRIGSGLADSYQVTTPGPYLLLYGLPLTLASVMFWAIGRLLRVAGTRSRTF